MRVPKKADRELVARWATEMVRFKANDLAFVLGRDSLINALVGPELTDTKIEQRNYLRNLADGIACAG